MRDNDVLTIPRRLPPELRFIYYAEGAANIVYKIDVERGGLSKSPLPTEIEPSQSQSSASSPGPTELETWEVDVSDAVGSLEQFRGKLLRLRKDRTHSVCPLKSQQDFENLIKPLFRPDELVQSAVVEIDDRLIARLNAELKALENLDKRPNSRCGIYLRHESHATIVDDIGFRIGLAEKVFELKPKWLLQSADAPTNARRCRTCALRLQRLNHKPPAETPQQVRILESFGDEKIRSVRLSQFNEHGPVRRNGFCPLDLVSKNKAHILKAIKHYTGEESESFTSDEINQIATYLVSSPVLQKLQRLQATLYTGSLLQANPDNINLLTLMTLRDCSLFLIVSAKGVTSARLSDLDLKSAARIEYWKDIERQLIDGGWYEKLCHDNAYIKCALEP